MQCLNVKKIPVVQESFLESSCRWYFQERCSSTSTQRNLTHLVLCIFCLPNLSGFRSRNLFLVEWNITEVTLSLFIQSLLQSIQDSTFLSSLMTIFLNFVTSSVSKYILISSANIRMIIAWTNLIGHKCKLKQ